MKMWYLFICMLLFSNIVAKHEEYKGYRVYNIEFLFEDQQDNLYKLKNDLIDFWKKPSLKYGTVGKAMVPPSHFDWFEERLKEIDVNRDVFIEDVQEYLNNKLQKSTRDIRNDYRSFNFDAFHRYDAILNHLYDLERAYSTSSATEFEVVQYGITAENRPLVYVKLTSKNNADKPVVVIEAGANPREWITVPSALNVIQRIIEGDQRYLNQLVWIIIPVLNPDGYEYTHTNLRLWTKSRSINSHLGFVCPGVHLNRNFDVDWLTSDSSSSPCSHLYAGVEPFSEIESQMVKHLLDEFNPTLYITIDNSGKFITYPWAFEKAATGLFRRHYLLGLEIVRALEGYELDSRAIAFGDRESGTSADYARMSAKSFYTFSIGVEGDDEDGVFVPVDDIKSVVEDVWRAVAAAANGVILN